MKKRTIIVVIILIVLAMLATASITLAKTITFNKITGHSYMLVEDWGDTEIWTGIVVKENPLNQALKGKITVRITSLYEVGVRYYETTPVCVNFYQDENGTPWAILVHRITADGVSGFGSGEPYEYAKWKIHDTQAPKGQGDTTYLAYECYDPSWENTCDTDGDGVGDAPYDEFWPADGEPPTCEDTNFVDFPLEVDEGNIVIH
jgi:hypothetical protein